MGGEWVLGDDVTDETAEKSVYIIVIAFNNLVSENNRKTQQTARVSIVTMVTWALWSLLLNLNPPLPQTFSHRILKNYKIGPGEKRGWGVPRGDAPGH